MDNDALFAVAKRRDTTSEDRRIIFYSCRAAMVNGALRPGIQAELAKQLGFEKKTVQRLWSKMARIVAPLLYNQDDEDHLGIIQDNAHILFGTGHSSRRKGKYIYDRVELQANIAAVPLKERMTVRHLAGLVGVPQTTVQRFLKPVGAGRAKANPEDVVLVRHTSNLHPTLTEENKLSRIMFCTEQINHGTLHLRHPKFSGQYDKVHIDEKWFQRR
jgi:hypothetical protein